MKKYLLIIMALVMLTPLMACEADDPLTEALYNNDGYYYYTSNNTWVNVNDHNATHENNGSDEIDVTDLSGHLADNQTPEAHASIHEYGGSDELNIKDLHMINSNVFMAPGGGNNNTFTFTEIGSGGGTGFTSYATQFVYTAEFTSVANDTVGYVMWASDFWQDYTLYRNRYRYSGRISPASTTNNMEMWVGYFEFFDVFPTVTSEHVALRLIENAGSGDGNAILYASNGNGTTGNQTQIETGFGQYDTADYCIIYGANDIKFYEGMNGAALTLKATHTGSRPIYNPGNYGIWVKTFDTTRKWGVSFFPQVMPGVD